MGRAGYCINHPSRPADFRCAQCHKPLCRDCVIEDGGDTFCSRKCLSRYRTFHRGYEEQAGKTPLSTVLVRVGVVVLVLLVVVLLLSAAGGIGWGPARPVYQFIRRLFIGR